MSQWSLEGDFVEVSRQRGGEQRKSDDKTQSLEKYTVMEEGSLLTMNLPFGISEQFPSKAKASLLSFSHLAEVLQPSFPADFAAWTD